MPMMLLRLMMARKGFDLPSSLGLHNRNCQPGGFLRKGSPLVRTVVVVSIFLWSGTRQSWLRCFCYIPHLAGQRASQSVGFCYSISNTGPVFVLPSSPVLICKFELISIWSEYMDLGIGSRWETYWTGELPRRKRKEEDEEVGFSFWEQFSC